MYEADPSDHPAPSVYPMLNPIRTAVKLQTSALWHRRPEIAEHDSWRYDNTFSGEDLASWMNQKFSANTYDMDLSERLEFLKDNPLVDKIPLEGSHNVNGVVWWMKWGSTLSDTESKNIIHDTPFSEFAKVDVIRAFVDKMAEDVQDQLTVQTASPHYKPIRELRAVIQSASSYQTIMSAYEKVLSGRTFSAARMDKMIAKSHVTETVGDLFACMHDEFKRVTGDDNPDGDGILSANRDCINVVCDAHGGNFVTDEKATVVDVASVEAERDVLVLRSDNYSLYQGFYATTEHVSLMVGSPFEDPRKFMFRNPPKGSTFHWAGAMELGAKASPSWSERTCAYMDMRHSNVELLDKHVEVKSVSKGGIITDERIYQEVEPIELQWLLDSVWKVHRPDDPRTYTHPELRWYSLVGHHLGTCDIPDEVLDVINAMPMEEMFVEPQVYDTDEEPQVQAPPEPEEDDLASEPEQPVDVEPIPEKLQCTTEEWLSAGMTGRLFTTKWIDEKPGKDAKSELNGWIYATTPGEDEVDSMLQLQEPEQPSPSLFDLQADEDESGTDVESEHGDGQPGQDGDPNMEVDDTQRQILEDASIAMQMQLDEYEGAAMDIYEEHASKRNLNADNEPVDEKFIDPPSVTRERPTAPDFSVYEVYIVPKLGGGRSKACVRWWTAPTGCGGTKHGRAVKGKQYRVVRFHHAAERTAAMLENGIWANVWSLRDNQGSLRDNQGIKRGVDFCTVLVRPIKEKSNREELRQRGIASGTARMLESMGVIDDSSLPESGADAAALAEAQSGYPVSTGASGR